MNMKEEIIYTCYTCFLCLENDIRIVCSRDIHVRSILIFCSVLPDIHLCLVQEMLKWNTWGGFIAPLPLTYRAYYIFIYASQFICFLYDENVTSLSLYRHYILYASPASVIIFIWDRQRPTLYLFSRAQTYYMKTRYCFEVLAMTLDIRLFIVFFIYFLLCLYLLHLEIYHYMIYCSHLVSTRHHIYILKHEHDIFTYIIYIIYLKMSTLYMLSLENIYNERRHAFSWEILFIIE